MIYIVPYLNLYPSSQLISLLHRHLLRKLEPSSKFLWLMPIEHRHLSQPAELSVDFGSVPPKKIELLGRRNLAFRRLLVAKNIKIRKAMKAMATPTPIP